jgi:hypothetical protein
MKVQRDYQLTGHHALHFKLSPQTLLDQGLNNFFLQRRPVPFQHIAA